MSQVQSVVANPFALMMNPAEVMAAIEASGRLGALNSQIYRPLDKPLIPKKGKGSDLDAYDREVELADDVAIDLSDDTDLL